MSERHEAPRPSEISTDERALPRLKSEESTAPFLLERSSSDLSKAAQEAVATEQREKRAEEKESATEAPVRGPSEQRRVLRMARRLGAIVLVNASLYLAIAAFGAIRYSRDRTAIPEVVLAIVAGALALWGGLAGYHLLQASRARPDAGHQLSGAFSNFRSIFILKGTGLFLFLALGCFAFSAVLSLAALL